MNAIKAKTIIICVGLATAGYMTKSHASEWPAIAVAKNARVFASFGPESMCIEVAHLDGALPYCLAIRRQDPSICKVIKDPLAQVLCREDAKPK